MSAPTAVAAGAYALLAEGATIEIRHAVPDDYAAIRDMHEALSCQSAFLRFFGLSRLAPQREARRLTRDPAPDHAALLGLLKGQLVGVASYECTSEPAIAEIAFAVADHMHGQGIATLLLEHLVSLARSRGVRSFVAETLPENRAMLGVFAAAGLPTRRRAGDGMIEVTFPLPRSGGDLALDGYLDAVAVRERQAAAASLRHLLRPDSVAVVGASRRTGSIGRAILRNVASQGFPGRVYAVNPCTPRVEGVECVPSPLALPEPVDVAVLAVPVPEILRAADECGRRGVRALVVITAGVDAETGAGLLATCRRHGMRLAGPNCFGVAVPEIGLNATFAAHRPVPGRAGLVVQSGGIGVALLRHLSRLGIGVSSFASVGDKYDVSSNDMLLWWEQDQATELAVLHLESFGNPRKFARTARRVCRQLPVLTVNPQQPDGDAGAGVLDSGRLAGQLGLRQALFEQAGVVAAANFGELLEAAAVFAAQPLPRGPRVAVVSNAGEVGALAATAAAAAGLVVATHAETVTRALTELLPAGATAVEQVNATLAVAAEPFRRSVETAAADDGVDAVLAVVVPTAAGDLVAAVRDARVDKPLVAVVLDQSDNVRLLPATGERNRQVPAYLSPDRAARALAHAVRYQAWRARPGWHVPQFTDLRDADARGVVHRFLARRPAGGWLPPDQTARLLDCYGIASGDQTPPTVPPAGDGDGPPAPPDGPTAAPDGHVTAAPGEHLAVERRADDGLAVAVGVTQEPVFGPLVIFGLAGRPTKLLADRVARLAPLARADAAEMIHSVRAAPLLLGDSAAPPVDVAAVEDLLLRVSRLADDVPEIVEIDLSPVLARADGAQVDRARVRVAPITPTDPFLRKLR